MCVYIHLLNYSIFIYSEYIYIYIYVYICGEHIFAPWCIHRVLRTYLPYGFAGDTTEGRDQASLGPPWDALGCHGDRLCLSKVIR